MKIILCLFLFVALNFHTASAAPNGWQSAFGCDESDARTFPRSTCKIVMNGGWKSASDGPNAGLTELISVELWESFVPKPDTQTVMLYKNGQDWRLEGFVARIESAPEQKSIPSDVRYSRNQNMRATHLIVSDARVKAFLKTHPFPDRRADQKPEQQCYDGSQLALRYAKGDEVQSRYRHICEGRTNVDAFAEAFLSFAVELDPGLESYVDAFIIAQDSDDPP